MVEKCFELAEIDLHSSDFDFVSFDCFQLEQQLLVVDERPLASGPCWSGAGQSTRHPARSSPRSRKSMHLWTDLLQGSVFFGILENRNRMLKSDFGSVIQMKSRKNYKVNSFLGSQGPLDKESQIAAIRKRSSQPRMIKPKINRSPDLGNWARVHIRVGRLGPLDLQPLMEFFAWSEFSPPFLEGKLRLPVQCLGKCHTSRCWLVTLLSGKKTSFLSHY